jgi:hypothetical protein
MNCCEEHGDCRQGRDCPVRMAKVKSSTPKYPEPQKEAVPERQVRSLLGVWATGWMAAFGLYACAYSNHVAGAVFSAVVVVVALGIVIGAPDA